MRAEALTIALRGSWHGSYGSTCCPAHEDKNPSLSIRDGDNGLLLFCHAGCAYADVARAIAGKVSANPHFGSTAYRRPKKLNQDRHRDLARTIWENAQPNSGTQAEAYLRERSIQGPLPESLRFDPELRHPTGCRLPAMVGRIDRGSEICTGIHRTFLEPGAPKKTARSPAKAMLGRCAGGAVRLRSGSSALVVCEGIETGLSLCDALDSKFAVWAALSTSGVTGVVLPRPEAFSFSLIIAADGDSPGQRAANALAKKANRLGWNVEIVAPPDGLDFNDLARHSRHG